MFCDQECLNLWKSQKASIPVNYRWIVKTGQWSNNDNLLVAVSTIAEAIQFIKDAKNTSSGRIHLLDLDTNELCYLCEYWSQGMPDGTESWYPGSLTDSKLLLTLMDAEGYDYDG